jgi:tRNA threonylcarbamoyl adenosine modification protein YjeE
LQLPTLAATQAFAFALAGWVQAGDAVALHGGMGSGKTTLVAALVQALGLPHVAGSPTYTLVHEYLPKGESKGLAVWHSDWYRLKTAGAQALWHEALAWHDETAGLAVVEWPDRAELPAEVWTLHVTLAPLPELGQEARAVTLAQPLATFRGWEAFTPSPASRGQGEGHLLPGTDEAVNDDSRP